MSNPKYADQVFIKTYDSTNIASRVLPVGGFASPSSTDAVVVSYPDSVTEVFSFKSGGVSGTLLMTVTLTYTDSTKADLSAAVKT